MHIPRKVIRGRLPGVKADSHARRRRHPGGRDRGGGASTRSSGGSAGQLATSKRLCEALAANRRAGSLTLSLLLPCGHFALHGLVFHREADDAEAGGFPARRRHAAGAKASADLAEKVQVKQAAEDQQGAADAASRGECSDGCDAAGHADGCHRFAGRGQHDGVARWAAAASAPAGSGGGFGSGTGMGGMGGMTFKPIFMFGMELKDVKKIAVVMDVSRSMTRYLPIVTKELDKVAFGSNLVLYFGCGLTPESKRRTRRSTKPSSPHGRRIQNLLAGVGG
jgi:hypothetical protein